MLDPFPRDGAVLLWVFVEIFLLDHFRRTPSPLMDRPVILKTPFDTLDVLTIEQGIAKTIVR